MRKGVAECMNVREHTFMYFSTYTMHLQRARIFGVSLEPDNRKINDGEYKVPADIYKNEHPEWSLCQIRQRRKIGLQVRSKES